MRPNPAELQSTVAVMNCADYAPATVREAVNSCLESVPGAADIIHPDATVLVKPNLLSPRDPAEAVTTHPAVVQAVVEYAFEHGAGRVWLGDSCAGDHPDQVLWEKTGMKEVAEATGAELKSFEGAVQGVPCAGKQLPTPQWMDEVDAWISVPKLKTHTLTVLTCAMKNTYGLVAGDVKSLYHGQNPSPRSMSRFLVEVHRAFPPDLVVVDAVTAMEGHGPANGTPRDVGMIMAGRDAVAVDAVAARLLGGDWREVPMLRIAAQGEESVRSVCEKPHMIGNAVQRIGDTQLKPSLGRFLQRIPEPVFGLATGILSCRPRINPQKCVGCGTCARICSQKAISRRQNSDTFEIDAAHCIMCMCCSEACPYNAVEVRSPLRFFQAVRHLAHRITRTR